MIVIKIIKKIFCFYLPMMGIDFPKMWNFVTYLPGYIFDLKSYKDQGSDRFPITLKNIHPILSDKSDKAGNAYGHYFYQDLWAAKKIYKAKPKKHTDIGSRVDGFISHLLVFREVDVIDIRPLKSTVKGLNYIQSDATLLQEFEDNSLESISTLHVAEHFGLGRYGDPIDPQACFTFMQSLQRVLKPGGTLYFSVPVGIERVAFNAHRIFTPKTILDQFKDLDLKEFSVVHSDGDYIEKTDPLAIRTDSFACGLFEFTKPK